MAFDARSYIKQALGSLDTLVQDYQDEHPVNVMSDVLHQGTPLNNPMSAWDPSDPLRNAGRPSPNMGATPLNGVFRNGLQKLINDFGGKVKVVSGSRDSSEQAKLYAKAVAEHGAADAANWAAPPGHSNHERGIAADLSFSDPATQAAVHSKAQQYGLWFPLNNEAWHIEPLGSRKGK